MKYKCKTCVPPERHPGCHSTCEDYIQASEAHRKLNKEIRSKKEFENGLLISETRRRHINAIYKRNK